MGTFSLLTFNCFGAPGMGKTSARLRRLADELNHADYGVVCLQEVQTHRYRDLLVKACERCYPAQAHQHFVHAPKGGLLTLSRYAFEKREFVLFAGRGLWYTPAVTDWILHKGVLITQMRIDDLPVTVMNTHLTANYSGDWSRASRFARQEHGELMQIAELVKVQPRDRLVIVCGDFNIPRRSWMYESLLAATGLIDPLAGDTRPTFRPHLGMGEHYGMPIDFTLYRAPAGLDVRVDSDLRFSERVEVAGRRMHLSDHNAVETRLAWA